MAGSAIVGTLRAILSLDTAEFDSAAARVSSTAKTWSKDLGSMGSKATTLGSSLSKVLTLPILGIGYAAVEAGSKFEQTMNQVAAVTNTNAEGMERLSAASAEWGSKTKFSNNEAAEAMLELGKAGFDADKTIAALPTTLALATAANMDLGEAAAMTANVMNTFGLEANDLAHANDVLVAAANSSTINVTDLREALKFVGPVANIAGVSLADVAAASAVLGEKGIKAEMAGTALRGMFAELLSPGKNATAMLGELGFAQEVAAGHTVSWTAMLDALHGKFEQGKESSDRFAGMVMESFGKRAGPAVIAMASEGGDAIKTLSGELDASTGSAQRMTDAFMKGLPGAMEVAKGSMETAFASIEKAIAPTLTVVLEGVAKLAGFVSDTLVPAFMSLPEPVRTASVVILGILAAVGPVLIVLGSLFTAASSVAAAFTTTGIATTALGALMPALGTAFAVLTGPIGLVLGAIVGLGLAWYKWGDDVKAVVSSAYAAVKDWLWDKLEPVLTPIIGLMESIGKAFEAFGKLVGAVVEKVYGDTSSWLGEKLSGVFNTLASTVQTVVQTVGGWIGKIPDSLLPLLGPVGAVVLAFRHWDEISKIAQAVYTGVKTWMLDKFTDIVNGVKAKVDAVTKVFEEMYDKVVGHSFVPDMIEGIRKEFAKLPDAMEAPTRGSTASVSSMFDTLKGGVLGKVGELSTELHAKFGALADLLDGPLGTVKTLVESKFTEMKTSALTHMQSMFDGISGKFSEWGSKAGELFTSHIGGPIGTGLGNLASSLVGGLGSILSGGLTSLFQLAMPYVVAGMSKLGKIIWEGVQKFTSWLGGLFKGEGAKTNDLRDDLKERLGGDRSGAGLDAKLADNMDPDVNAAYTTFMTTGNRDDLNDAAAILAAALGIPLLADGGIVRRATMAMIGEDGPEAVIPLEKLYQVLGIDAIGGMKQNFTRGSESFGLPRGALLIASEPILVAL